MKYLLDNKLAPLTFNWGFLEAPVDAVSNAYVSWQRKILQSVKVTPINLPLIDALRKVQPLDTGSQRQGRNQGERPRFAQGVRHTNLRERL